MLIRLTAFVAVLMLATATLAQENKSALDQIVAVLKVGPEAAKEDQTENTFNVAGALHKLRDLPVDPKRRDEISKLLDPLLTAKNAGIRGEAVYIIDKWGTAANVPSLIELLKYRDSLIRHKALNAIGKIGGKQAAEAVGEVLASGNDTDQAMYSLSNMGEVAEPIAWKHIGSKNSSLHQAACYILGKVGGSKSLTRMKALDKKQVKGGSGGISDAIRQMEARLVKR